jgi:hypothetical protein
LGLHRPLDGVHPWQAEVEDGAAFCVCSKPDSSSMPRDHCLANRQADPRTGILVAVEPLEQVKNPLAMLRIDPDAIIADRKDPVVFMRHSGEVDLGSACASELDRVIDQAGESVDDLVRVAAQFRQFVVSDTASDS